VNEALAALAGDCSALYSRMGRPSIPPEKLLRSRGPWNHNLPDRQKTLAPRGPSIDRAKRRAGLSQAETGGGQTRSSCAILPAKRMRAIVRVTTPLVTMDSVSVRPLVMLGLPIRRRLCDLEQPCGSHSAADAHGDNNVFYAAALALYQRVAYET
jgi:hypothetical protein